jgi:asparaginyl-tRNA synthetase
MIAITLKNQISKIDLEVKNSKFDSFELPKYDPKTHYVELTRSGYFYAIIALRQNLKMIADHYFVEICDARNVDLFMVTPSISSPMGLGSDSQAIPIKFGNLDSYLVDSSQFGFEPLLLNGMDKIYCYLPSIRGEDPDKRHLNQFFNCEAEIRGDAEKLYPLIEDFVKILAEGLLLMPNILEKLSLNYKETLSCLNDILGLDKFPEITFDEAVDRLVANGNEGYVRFNESGRDLTSAGELKLAEIAEFKTPFWVKNFDRDRVAFYQKPNSSNSDKVINADMIFPPLIKDSFGGEIVGSGQRQDSAEEMLESLKRQNVNPKPYEWYVDLRRQPNYQTTSGFGLGVERFITWILCRDDIKDVILYPRIKNVETNP